MNESAPRRPAIPVSLLLAAALAACAPEPAPDAPLKGAPMRDSFALTDQNGRRVSDRDFAGKYRLVYFGYTYCPDVCPIDMRVIGAGLRRFESEDAARASRVQPIFITIDPARDTADTMKIYVGNFHPRMVGLTGSEADIAAAAKAYRVYYAKAKGYEDKPDYLMDHSTIIYFMGPDGKFVKHFTYGTDAKALAEDLREAISG